jgi:epoxyqueuosine reductase
MEASAYPIIDPVALSTFVKEEAAKLGFDACGIAPARPLPSREVEYYREWLKQGFQGDMHYMERNIELRMDPGKLVPDAASVIVVALNYATFQSAPTPFIARYARRPDYHPFIRKQLQTLLDRLKETGLTVSGRAFSDSAPLAERYWAEQAGLGWVGKNHVLIMPGKGSWFLLGALVVTLPLQYDAPMSTRCGTCNRCIDACPSQALQREGRLDTRRCLSYLTIEKKGDFTSSQATLLQGTNRFFGCDACQEVCPWNHFSVEAVDERFPLLLKLMELDIEKLEDMDTETFYHTFRGTSLERSGWEALVRNLKAIKKVRPSE